MNLENTSNLGQKFESLNTILYHKLLPAIAKFIQVHQFLGSLFIDNVKSDHQYMFGKRMTPIIRASGLHARGGTTQKSGDMNATYFITGSS